MNLIWPYILHHSIRIYASPSSKCLSRTLLRKLPIKPPRILAVIIDHIVAPHPSHLSYLCIVQFAIYRRCPPISGRWISALSDAGQPMPLASSEPEPPASGYERCAVPVNLFQTASRCPVISIPYTGVCPHSLLVRVRDANTFVVSEDSDWYFIDIPPEQG